MSALYEKFIEELKNKVNIVEVVQRYCVLQRKGLSNYWARCPLPGHSEKTPSFTVNEPGQFYHCFGCGRGGDVIKFICEVEDLQFFEAVKFLADMYKIPMPENDNYDENTLRKQKVKKDRLYALLKDTALFYVKNLSTEKGKPYLDYLEKRGITAQTIRYFGIGASVGYNELPNYLLKKGYTKEEALECGVCQLNERGNLFDSQANRVVVPIINSLGKVIAFGGRVIVKTDIGKYKNTKETSIFLKKRTLFGINYLKNEKLKGNLNSVIMVEGYMDVISLNQAGYKNVVASMGTSLTSEQAKLLKRYTDVVYVSYDGDSAGQKATVRSLEIFENEGLLIKVVNLPDGKDPDEVVKNMGKEAFDYLLEKAEPLIDYKLRLILKDKNLKDLSDKRRFIQESLEVIKGVSDEFLREELLKKVRDKSGITYESLKRDLERGGIKIAEEKIPLKTVNKNSLKSDIPERFILYAYLNGKEYAKLEEFSELYFNNKTRQKIADFILDYDGDNLLLNVKNAIDESELIELNEILNSGEKLSNSNQEKYYNDCVKILLKFNLENEIKTLNELFNTETDLQKREEIADLLLKKTTKFTEI